MTPKQILRKPYTRCFVRDEKSGRYTAYIREFPGCITEGETMDDANFNLTDAAMSWLEVLIGQGLKVPPPNEHAWTTDQFNM